MKVRWSKVMLTSLPVGIAKAVIHILFAVLHSHLHVRVIASVKLPGVGVIKMDWHAMQFPKFWTKC